MFLNEWKDKDVTKLAEDFGVDTTVLDGIEVIVASYESEEYSGRAYVLFAKDGELYEVHGSHCSCYGLSEDGWSPEPCTLDELRVMLNKRANWMFRGEHTTELTLKCLEDYLDHIKDPVTTIDFKF